MKKHIAAGLLFLLGVVSTFGFGFGVSDQIEDLIDMAEDDDWELDTLIVARLEDDADTTWTIGSLNRYDEYLVTVVCDWDCDDIDVCVVDDDFDEKCDNDFGNTAIVMLRGAGLKIEVDMYECDGPYCFYGLLVFRD